jgi:hypothetical protein
MISREPIVSTVDCKYYSSGRKCGALGEFDREGCKNTIKNACCFTCEQRSGCDIGCETKYTGKEQTPLSEGQQLEVGLSVQKSMSGIMGLVLLGTGIVMVLIFGFSAGPAFELFRLFPTWTTFFIFLFYATPPICIIAGIVLIVYAATDRKKPDIVRTSDMRSL